MIVVSNTSPLTNLAAIGQFNLLRHLYGQVHIPEGVWAELNAEGRRWPGRDEVAAVGWVHRHTVGNQTLVMALQQDLDRGEAETIALALEMAADLTLMDEREGRHKAQRMGLNVAGTIGVLLDAKERGLLESMQPHLDGLRQTAGFFISEALYTHALEIAGEPRR
ncbi:MAG: DUF3368 domain-containing protein [Caldilineales bacterium]|nr:DUF3368 domain-containing protein [Caldilineales bacterium]